MIGGVVVVTAATAVLGLRALRHRPTATIQLVPSPRLIPGTGVTSYEQRSDGAVRITDASRTDSGSDQNPCFSPDGKQLLFTRFHRGYNRGPADLVLRTLATGEERVLVGDGEHDHVNVPFGCWDRSTNQIVFSSDRSGSTELWVVGSDGQRVRQLTDHRGDHPYTEPVFSPDGQSVAFERDQSSDREDEQSGQVLTMVVGGGTPVVVTAASSTNDDRLPSWGPGGRLLYQHRGRHDGAWSPWDVVIRAPVVAGGWSEPTSIVAPGTTASNETDNSWFPNGRWIVSSTELGGLFHPNLFALPVAVGSAVRLTTSPDREDGAPSASPDGQWLAFESHRTADGTSSSDLWLIAVPPTLR